MKCVFDHALKDTFETLHDSGISAKSFWSTHKGPLSLLAGEDFDVVFRARDMVEDQPALVQKLATKTMVGKAMFQLELIKVGRVFFRKTVKSRLADLLHLDFEASALEAFRAPT